jgi:hypothetical protein
MDWSYDNGCIQTWPKVSGLQGRVLLRRAECFWAGPPWGRLPSPAHAVQQCLPAAPVLANPLLLALTAFSPSAGCCPLCDGSGQGQVCLLQFHHHPQAR